MKAFMGGLLVVLMLLPSCNGPNSTYEEFGDRVNTKGFGHRYAQPEGQDELVLGPRDVVGIRIANNPDLDSNQPIRADGKIIMPWVGDVEVGGLAPTQIRDKITILLTPYIRDVSVQIIPLAINSKRIYIFTTGQFGELVASALPLQGDYTLVDLVSDIGGINEFTDDCHIRIVRADPRHPKPLDINLRDIVTNGYSAANITLRPDDIVWFPPTLLGRISQTLSRVTLPVRVLSRGINDVGNAIFFIEEGGVPRRGF